ncbi:MAG: isochorismatase family cysteine hydrolase [Nitrospirota bacterium]
MDGPKEALVIVDMLNDFCLEGAPLEVPQAKEVIPNIKRRLENARKNGVPVIFVCDAHDPDDIEFRNWPAHSVEDSPGSKVVRELEPMPGEVVIRKKTFFGFYGTNLDAELRKTGAEFLTITGCVTNICVMYTATEAVVRGYKVRVPMDCVAGLSSDMHEFALRQMREVLKAEII